MYLRRSCRCRSRCCWQDRAACSTAAACRRRRCVLVLRTRGDATESASLAELPCAVNVTAPPALRFRAVVAVTMWLEIVRPSAAPIPTLPPFAAPSASLDADAVCVAVSEIAPVVGERSRAGADRRRRRDVRERDRDVRRERDAAGRAVLRKARRRVGRRRRRVSEPALVSVALSPTDAVVVSLRIVSATDAPTPTVFAGHAVDLRRRLVRRRRRRRGVQRHSAAAGVHRGAGADRRGRVDREDRDRDRACDADRPGAAPDVVSVSNVLVASLPFTVSSASSSTPTAVTVEPTPIDAVFVTLHEVHGDRGADAERARVRRRAVRLRRAVRVLRRAQRQLAARR